MQKALQVVISHFNPVGFARRDQLLLDTLAGLKAAGVEVILVEVAHGGKDWKFTVPDHPLHVQARSRDELWVKESAFKLGIARATALSVGTFDGDIHFTDRHWVEKAVSAMHHHKVIQPFSRAHYMGPTGEHISLHNSFCYDWLDENQRYKIPINSSYPQHNFHPGLAWIWDRDTLSEMGGLLTCDILGGGDYMMARAMVGNYERVLPDGVTENYKIKIQQWQGAAMASVKERLGFISGTLIHFFHGAVASRNYESKWSIVVDNRFDPFRDLCDNADGIVQWSYQVSPRMKRDVSSYFRVRNEDSIQMGSRYL